jgi:hypothetical protein
MEGYCSTGQSSQRAVVPLEEEEEADNRLASQEGLCSMELNGFSYKPLIHFSFCLLNFILPVCRSNFPNVARAT